MHDLLDSPPPPLNAGEPNESLRRRLAELTPETLLAPAAIVDRAMAECCLAGLWLRHNFLDESHTISQGIDTRAGSYWHAIKHRREGDYSNSKYWFRRVGEHAIFPALAAAARELAEQDCTPDAAWLREPGDWDPYRFVDLVEACVRGRSQATDLCRAIADAEWRLLYDFCANRATGNRDAS